MKFLLALSTILLGSCYGLQPGLEYQYRYSARVASGIPEIQSQFAAAGIEADVILQVINPTTIKAKFVNVQAGSLNEIVKGSLRDPLAIPYAPVKKDAAHLAQPFAINIAEGDLASLEVNAEEPVWVTNIRRSIANTLRVEKLRASLKTENPFADGPFFVLDRENSIFGKCSTIYTLADLPEDLTAEEEWLSKQTIAQDVQAAAGAPALGTKHMTIKRTVDFTMCEKNVQLKRDGTPINCKPGQLMCEPEIQRASAGTYVVRGDANALRIERAIFEGSVIFRAIDENSERIQTITNQTLSLEAVRTIGEEMAVKTPVKIVDSFHFEYKPAAKGEDGTARQPLIEEFASAIELEPTDFAAALAGIIKTIKELVTFVSTMPTSNTIQEEYAERVHVAGKAIGLLTKSEIQQVHNGIAQSGSPDLDSLPMKTFAQLLIISGSEPATQYLLEIIGTAPAAQRNALLLDFTTSILDIRSPAVLKPTMEFVLTKLSMATEPVYKSTALINFATVFQRLCVKPKTTFVHTAGCDADALLDTFIPAITREIEVETEGWKKLAYVHALVNLGHQKIWKVLKPIALGKAITDSRVRIHALWGFAGRKNVEIEVKWEAIRLVLSIFENYNNNYEVRSHAFFVLMSWDPSQAFLHQVATGTWRDPSNQIAALVTHTLTTLSKSECPCVNKVVKVLPLAKPAPFASISTSFYKNMITHISKTTPVAWNQFAMLANTNGIFPRQLAFMVHNSFMDVNHFAFDFGANILGVNEIFKNIAAFLKMRVADTNMQRGAMKLAKELYDQIKEKVGAQMIATPKKLEVIIWAQFFRTYQMLLPIIADIDTLIENPMSVLGKLQERMHFQHLMFKEPVILETAFPNELGLPHLVQLATPTISYIIGSIQMHLHGVAEGKLDAIKFDLDLTIVENSKMQVLAKTALPWTRTAAAVGIDHVKAITLPIAANVLVDLKESKMQFSVKPLGDKVELLGVKNVPFTGIIGALPMLPIEGFAIKPVQAFETPFATNMGILADVGLAAKYKWEGDIPNQLTFNNLFTRFTSMRPIPTTSAIIPNTAKFWTTTISLDVAACANKAIAATIAYAPVEKVSDSSITALNEYPQTLKINKLQQNYQAIPAGKIDSVHAVVEFIGSASKRYEAVISRKYTGVDLQTAVSPIATNNLQVALVKEDTTALCFNIEASTPVYQPLAHALATPVEEFKTNLKIAAMKGSNCQGTSPVAKINAELWLTEDYAKILRVALAKWDLVAANILERTIAPLFVYNHYKIKASWTDALPPSFYTAVYTVNDMIIALGFPIFRTYEVNPTNLITIEGELNERLDTWRAEIKAPTLEAVWEDAWGPGSSFWSWGLSLINHGMASVSTIPVHAYPGVKSFALARPVACSIDNNNNVQTFDGVSFPATPSTCWSIAAMSLVNDPMPFAVQVKTKGVPTARIVLPAENVVIQATGAKEVLVNGKPITIGVVSTPLSELSHAYKVSDGIFIKAGNDVAVKLTNERIYVYAPSWYRGQVGGLCGDNNGEVTSDLAGPTGCVYTKPAYFTAAWTVAEGGCDAGAIEALKTEVKGFQATCPRHHVLSSYPTF